MQRVLPSIIYWPEYVKDIFPAILYCFEMPYSMKNFRMRTLVASELRWDKAILRNRVPASTETKPWIMWLVWCLKCRPDGLNCDFKLHSKSTFLCVTIQITMLQGRRSWVGRVGTCPSTFSPKHNWKGTFVHSLFTTSRIIFGLANLLWRSSRCPYVGTK